LVIRTLKSPAPALSSNSTAHVALDSNYKDETTEKRLGTVPLLLAMNQQKHRITVRFSVRNRHPHAYLSLRKVVLESSGPFPTQHCSGAPECCTPKTCEVVGFWGERWTKPAACSGCIAAATVKDPKDRFLLRCYECRRSAKFFSS